MPTVSLTGRRQVLQALQLPNEDVQRELSTAYSGAAVEERVEAQGFVWGDCEAGVGVPFKQALEEKTIALVGTIPKGKWDIEVRLNSENDIDVQLYDLDNTTRYAEGQAIVAYCYPLPCNVGVMGMQPTAEKGDYGGMRIEYSGYNGVDGKLGDEYIRIDGEVKANPALMVFAYREGTATVNYKWGHERSACCLGEDNACGGSFTADIPLSMTVTVGEIPRGKKNLRVTLQAAKDIDVQLYDEEDRSKFREGQAIIAYCYPSPCNNGILGMSAGPEEGTYKAGRGTRTPQPLHRTSSTATAATTG